MILPRHLSPRIILLQHHTWLTRAAVRYSVLQDCNTRLLHEECAQKKIADARLMPSFHLDTHRAVVGLQAAGYELKHAEAVVKLIVESHESTISLQSSNLSQQDLELLEIRMKKELENLQHKLTILEHTRLDSFKNDYEVLSDKVGKLMGSFKEEVGKVQSNLQLDLNLEKGRIKEEATLLLKQVNDTNNRIDKEVAQVRTQIEAQKLESVKYFAGVSLSVVTVVLSVVLGLWRLLK